MTYPDAMQYIKGRLRFGSKLGLDNMRELLLRLNDPQEKLCFLHVAGTNGKGSVCQYLTNSLIDAGYKTGTFISPFVNDFNERIQIDGIPIDEDAFARCTKLVIDACGEDLEPTEFEVITAIGLLWFAEQQCDKVVLEVGLGGRFDATNIIPPPQVAVITSLSLDHTQQLGSTLDKIAFEKCGILKTGSLAVCSPKEPTEALAVIRREAELRSVPLTEAQEPQNVRYEPDKTTFCYDGEEYEITMLGEHQPENAAAAIAALRLIEVPLSAIRSGLARTQFAGRLELISRNPDILLDGAHNAGGAKALQRALMRYYKGKRIVLVLGMLRDKEYETCISLLAPLAQKVIATQPDNPRALSAQELAEVTKKYCRDVVTEPDRKKAFFKAKEIPCDLMCVCGSLFLIGGMKDWLDSQ